MSVPFPKVGRTLIRKSTCSSTHTLTQDSTSVCSINTQGSFSHLQPWPTERCALSSTLPSTKFHDPINGIVTCLAKISSDRFHRNDGPFWRSWSLCAVKDAYWAEIWWWAVLGGWALSRPSRFVGEDNDAWRSTHGYIKGPLLFNIHWCKVESSWLNSWFFRASLSSPISCKYLMSLKGLSGLRKQGQRIRIISQGSFV